MPAKNLSRPPRIGVDLLGGETDSQALLVSLTSRLSRVSSPLHLFIYIALELQSECEQSIVEASIHSDVQITLVPVTEEIRLDEQPIAAVKSKKGSSMHVGVKALKEKEIDTFISIGNTGALLTLCTLSLPLLKGVSRPALLAMLPTRKGPVAVLDVGANVSCKSHQFVEFAEMGVAFQRNCGIKNPTVGILNIGNEEIKGTQEIRQARTLIAERATAHPEKIPSFLGNVESHDVFAGRVDVLVTEGFSGNIFLKTAEAASAFIIHTVQNSLLETKAAPSQLVEELEKQFCHDAYPGALLIGCDGIVIKCHSYTDSEGVYNACLEGARLVREGWMECISLQFDGE